MTPIVVIGAGIAGLACAGRLVEAGLSVVVLDKGRGIGGRVATRRAGGLQFDHGAQYVTAESPGFAALLDRLSQAGSVATWADGSGRSHHVGTPGMSALAKALGAGLQVRQDSLVSAVAPVPGGWRLRVADSDLAAARLVITLPAPQVAGLLGADHPLVARLAGVRLAPCLTLMAACRGPAPFVTRKDNDDPLSWIAQDSSKPGRPGGEVTAWVAQASPAFSEAHLEKTPPEIAALMLPLLRDRLGASPGAVTHAEAHRWRYARVTAPLGQPFLRSADASLYLGGDWCIGPRVEAAWVSGTAIAEDLLAQMA
ncbi:MAG: FAD-dependent oxidoreductase [Rhodobacterales bacterium]|nr:MAG: FAD-dependent oxidoreductase [Rhodobacterales bacterium]